MYLLSLHLNHYYYAKKKKIMTETLENFNKPKLQLLEFLMYKKFICYN